MRISKSDAVICNIAGNNTENICLPVLRWGFDAIPRDRNSIKLVTQFRTRWLYGVGKFTFTRHLFDSHGMISMNFSLHCNVLSLYTCM